MLPGIINQLNLDWDNSTNYYLPTLKRHNSKLFAWLAPNGPQLGGVKEPGTPLGSAFWQTLDNIVTPLSINIDTSDWNNITVPGKFFIRTTQNVTANPPMNITSDWWVEVSLCYPTDGRQIQILQEATRHVTDPNTGYMLHRCFDGGNWGPWGYAYTQFSG